MPEYEFTRETDVPHDKVSIKFDHCNFTWGFKIKQLTEEQKKEKENNKKNKDDQYKIEVDDVKTNILNDINIDMKPGDFLAVVG